MNIISNALTATQTAANAGLRGPQGNGADADGDNDGGGASRLGKGRGQGGQIQQAIVQAFQSLGLNMPAQVNSAAASNASAGSTNSDGNAQGSAADASSVQNDMRQFMHTLFQALKGESAPDANANSSSGGSNTGGRKAHFAADLSKLISQSGNGTAPSDLQSAFSKLMQDMQATNAAGSSSSQNGSTDATATTLQGFLNQLQQNLGYGVSSLPATGNLISTQV
jgi:hypothetical protein